jgi:hypothetical protein
MKSLDEIECPQCGTPIPVSEALCHQLTQHIREELEEKVGQREKDLAVKEEELNDKAKKLGEERRSNNELPAKSRPQSPRARPSSRSARKRSPSRERLLISRCGKHSLTSARSLKRKRRNAPRKPFPSR